MRVLPGVGDLLCAVPAMRALRAAAPSGEITLVGMAGAEWMAARYPDYVDAVLACPSWPGLAEIDGDRGAAEPFLRQARWRRFGLAVQMHGDGSASNGLTAALGARRWIGLVANGRGAPLDGRGTVGGYRHDHHEVDRCLDVLRLVGVDSDDTALEFPLSSGEIAAAGRLAGDGSVAVIHPGASVAQRRWPARNFAAVAARLVRRVDAVVLTGSPGERDTTADVLAHLGGLTGVGDLAGATDLGQLGALLARASVVVANDTGVAHLAAAVGTPVVAVSGGTDGHRWAPRGNGGRLVGGRGRWPGVGEVMTAVDEAVRARSGRR